MTDASAASTTCILACRRFLLRHGASLGRVAVVGKGPQLFFMRLCTRLARFRKVRVFGSQAAADRWLLGLIFFLLQGLCNVDVWILIAAVYSRAPVPSRASGSVMDGTAGLPVLVGHG